MCDEAHLSLGASSEHVHIVDEHGERLYTARHALATVALAQACEQGAPPQASAALEHTLQDGLERGEEARYGSKRPPWRAPSAPSPQHMAR